MSIKEPDVYYIYRHQRLEIPPCVNSPAKIIWLPQVHGNKSVLDLLAFDDIILISNIYISQWKKSGHFFCKLISLS